jgi:hypothetical protein
MRKVLRKALVPMLALATLAGCARNTESAPRPPQEPSYVLVTNQSWLDMNVYVLRGTQRVRLGNVHSGSSARFRIPTGMVFGVTPLRFQVQAGSSRGVLTSFEIMVAPGEEVGLNIPSTVR